MNKNLLEVGNYTGVVSDENGYVKIVHKDSNDWEFKEILELENDLDYLHKRLTMTKNNLDKNKKDSIAANIWSACILVGEVFVYMVLHKQLPLSVTIAGMVCFYTFIKGFSIIEHGTRFTRHIKKKRLIERLEKIPFIDLINLEADSGIVAFNIDGIFSQDVAIYLNKYNICVRAGEHCAKNLKNATGVINTVRISLYFYNTESEVDTLVELLSDKVKIEKEML